LLINFLTRRPSQFRGSGATSILDLLEAQPAPDPAATAIFEAEYRKRLFHWAANEVMREFTPTSWAAFCRSAIDGSPPKEVATELQLSVGAVYIARSRVLARLKQIINERGAVEVAMTE
jgi:DNA-directed RNA polymerase specialized sigma24 family protein